MRKDITARKRTVGAVNRILGAHKTLKSTLLKLPEHERHQVLDRLVELARDLGTFVKTQASSQGAFSFAPSEETQIDMPDGTDQP